MKFVVSEDGGKTFPEPVSISQTAFIYIFPRFDTNSEQVYLVWWNLTLYPIIYLSFSDDGKKFEKFEVFRFDGELKSPPSIALKDNDVFITFSVKFDQSMSVDSESEVLFVKIPLLKEYNGVPDISNAKYSLLSSSFGISSENPEIFYRDKIYVVWSENGKITIVSSRDGEKFSEPLSLVQGEYGLLGNVLVWAGRKGLSLAPFYPALFSKF